MKVHDARTEHSPFKFQKVQKHFGLLTSLFLISSLVLVAPMLLSLAGAIPEAVADAPKTDFNGDGYADLAIGVPGEDINGKADAGSVNIIYGSGSGLSATAVPDQRFFQDSPDVADFSEANDLFGAAHAAGDFNGDGYTDLAVGVPDEDVGPSVDAGAVGVIYGSASGLSATAAVADQFWHQNSADVEGFVDTSEHFGTALATGDFDNDGFDDLAIGTPFDYVNSVGGAGSVNILYGGSLGLSPTEAPDQLWHQDSASVEDSVEFGDHFGACLVTGHFNDDDYADLAIGVPDEDINGKANAGSVNILYGSPASGLSATSVPDQRFFQDSAGIAGTSDPGDHFGTSLAAGDFNGDGLDDLAIGAVDDFISNSEADVIFGSSSGLSPTAVLSDQLLEIFQPTCGEQLDFTSLSSGDFDNDGFDDLAFGSVGDNNCASSATPGSASILFGTAAGFVPTSDLDFGPTPNQYFQGHSKSGGFGTAVAAGDFNDDGFDDLAVGEPAYDPNYWSTYPGSPGPFTVHGGVTLGYGSSDGIAGSLQIWTQDTANVEDTAEHGDMFGQSLR
jgi:hypothetical protein